MAKSYCLTIEIKSAHIESGLGFMIAFRTHASEKDEPQDHPDFKSWSQSVKAAVVEAGDKVFSPDAYTRKLAIAGLMHDLDDINRNNTIQIGFVTDVPAVQIHSTNPRDTQIEIDFTDEDGHFRVVEKNPAYAPRAAVHENGKTGIIEAGRKNFPFDKPSDKSGDNIKKSPPAALHKPRSTHPGF